MTEEQYLPQDGGDKEIINIRTDKNQPLISYWGQIGLLIGFTGAGLIIGSFSFVLIWRLMTGNSIVDLEKNLSNIKYTNAIRLGQLISSILMFFVPVFFYALVVNRRPLQHLGFRKLASIKQVVLVIVIAAFGFLLSGALSEVTQLIPLPKSLTTLFKSWEDNSSEQVMAIVKMKNLVDYLFVLLVIAITPAIVEETLFRGGFQQLIEKWSKNIWIAIIITSILFSAIHGSYYGFLSRAALGIMLGFLFYYSRNIWLNIFMHFLNNAIIASYLYVITRKGELTKEAMDDSLHMGYPAILMTILLIIILYALFKEFKKESMRIGAALMEDTISNPGERLG